MISYAYASRVDSALADGDYELVPVQGGDQLGGEVNAVDANQAPGQVPEEQLTNPDPEGKPRSMSQFFTYATMLCLCLCIYVSGVDMKP